MNQVMDESVRAAGIGDRGAMDPASRILVARQMNVTVWDLAQLQAGDGAWMARAIAIAAEAGAAGDVPVGAVIVDGAGAVVAEAQNRKQRDGDPTAHAEILALRQAGRSRGNWHLNDCTLYVTLEPCPMCAGALIQARIGRLVYGTADPKAGAIASVLHLPEGPASNHRFPVVAGVCEAECRTQLQAWFAARRRHHRAQKRQTQAPTQA
jgi:tRNA(adenine34) deaminase